MSWEDFDAPVLNTVTIGGAQADDYNAYAATGGNTLFDSAVDGVDEYDTVTGKRKKPPVPSKSPYDGAYIKMSEENVPIPLRVLMATQQHFQVVTVETDTGYTYTGVLESVDANMNVKIRDAEIKKEVWAEVKGERAVDNSNSVAGPSPPSNTSSNHHMNMMSFSSLMKTGGRPVPKYERKVIYHKKAPTVAADPSSASTSVMIRGANIVMIQLPSSLETEQRYLAAIIKKDIADKRRRDKRERLERIVEMGKKRERESAATTSATAAPDGSTVGGTHSGVGDKDKKKLAKIQEAARAASQKLRKILKTEARVERQKEKRQQKKKPKQ